MTRDAFWLVVAALLAACSSAVDTTGSLEGHLVFNLEAGVEPVSLAEITIAAEGPLIESVLTDQNGQFIIADLEPGTYTLRADLQLWTRETNAQVAVEVIAGQHVRAPDLVVTPAGSVRGHITIQGGKSPKGFRVQILGTGLAAVADDKGDFVIRRVPAKAEPGYELLAERADIGSARRAGVDVTPFEEADIGTVVVVPGGSGNANTHPHFDVIAITFTSNGTPLEDAVVPLPYLVGGGYARRFDQVALSAPATDPDGDFLTYEWSASAGTLIDALSPDARWRPDEYSGSQGTISVTVRDGHGGIARMSNDIEILDLFAGSANRHGDRVVHSYRVEGGPWRIDLVELGYPTTNSQGVVTWVPDVAQNRLEVATAKDPRPLLFENHIVYRNHDDLWRFDLRTDVSDTLPLRPLNDSMANPTVVAQPPNLWVITATDSNRVTGYDIEVDDRWTAATCTTTCSRLAVDGGVAGFVAFYGADVFVLASGTERLAAGIVGRGLASHSGLITYVSRNGGTNGRSLVAGITPLGQNIDIYSGFYNITVWVQQNESVLISEQEYRALRHPPFLRWLTASGGWQGDYRPKAEGWMAERAHDLTGGVALVRQVSRADWPEPFDESRSEIARVDLARAAQ